MAVELSFPVRYAETDAQQVVYYANHIAWFELGYEALLRGWGHPLTHGRPAVLEAACRYLAPIRYGEEVTLESMPAGEEEGHLWVAHRLGVVGQPCAVGVTLLEGAAGLCPEEARTEVAGRKIRRDVNRWTPVPTPPGRFETVSLRVRYAETEPIGGAHFSRYFGWLEVARITFLRRIGLDYARLEKNGSPFVIAWAGCHYLAPAHLDDPLRVTVWVQEVRERSFVLDYRIVHEGGRPVALGRTVQTFIGGDGRSVPIPPEVRETLQGQLLEETGGAR